MSSDRCGRPVRYHVRDFRKIAIRAVCERPDCRTWAGNAILGLGYSPHEYPVTNITSGCQATLDGREAAHPQGDHK